MLTDVETSNRIGSRDLILQLQQKIDQELDPHKNALPFALLDFPDHANVGDSAIWLGELAYFKKSGRSPAYVCRAHDIDWGQLEKMVPKGTIYIHGGGNFGDLWPVHQKFRLDVLRRFPNRQVIQLPQSVYFQNSENIAATKLAIENHGDFILMVRDRASLEFASRHFNCVLQLCPDTAFCLGPKPRSANAIYDELYLLRTDQEKIVEIDGGTVGLNALTADWLDEPKSYLLQMRALRKAIRLSENILPNRHWATNELFRYAARARVSRGLKLISQGRHVTTDRLHAHILCTLLEIPHTILDNSYGKISGFVQAWGTKWNGVNARFADK